MIDKKFSMFSTKEWLQFLQYKLSPEREKELMDKSLDDPFLKEAVDTIETQDNRPIAFQSLSYLIGQIEDATGVSESNIAAVRTRRTTEPFLNKKLLFILGGIVLAGLIGFGIYKLVSTQTKVVDQEELDMMDTLSNSQFVDTSTRPFDVIPNSAPSVDTMTNNPIITPPTGAAAKKPRSSYRTSTTTSDNAASNSNAPTSGMSASSNAGQAAGSEKGNEREQFNKAEEMYKNGNKDGAKQILNNLNSYDNPMKAQSANILENMNKAAKQ